MRNEQNGSVKVHNGIFKDFFAVDVKMVGRFVKNQEIIVLHGEFG